MPGVSNVKTRAYVHTKLEEISKFCVYVRVFTGHDIAIQPDQSKPALDIIDDLLSSATGPNNTLTPHDLSLVSTRRRAEARARNSEFSLSTFHKLFGSSK